jgi:hypothetical protein
MTIIGMQMTKISLGLTVEFYMTLVHLISTTTKSSFFFMECQLVDFLHDFSLTQSFAHPFENKKHCFIKQYKRAKALFNNSGKLCYLNANQPKGKIVAKRLTMAAAAPSQRNETRKATQKGNLPSNTLLSLSMIFPHTSHVSGLLQMSSFICLLLEAFPLAPTR